jgi:hypothetical protein
MTDTESGRAWRGHELTSEQLYIYSGVVPECLAPPGPGLRDRAGDQHLGAIVTLKAALAGGSPAISPGLRFLIATGVAGLIVDGAAVLPAVRQARA